MGRANQSSGAGAGVKLCGAPTPGPWRVDNSDTSCPQVLGADDTLVTEIPLGGFEDLADTVLADAHLIAAAPTLLAAAVALVDAWTHGGAHSDYEHVSLAVGAIQDAIGLARGETSGVCGRPVRYEWRAGQLWDRARVCWVIWGSISGKIGMANGMDRLIARLLNNEPDRDTHISSNEQKRLMDVAP